MFTPFTSGALTIFELRGDSIDSILKSPLLYKGMEDTDSENRMRHAEKEAIIKKQNDLRIWMEALLKEPFPDPDFTESLRSGVLLCRYVLLYPQDLDLRFVKIY